MTTPSEVYDYDMTTRARVLRKRQEIPSGHNPSDYVTTRIMAPSHDGALVPVSILHRKDLKRDGSAPLLLYGYGSYGMAMPASFAANRLSLVDRGFVYAIAHIRGGADKGWGWYLDGKREKKTNTFDDFAAAGRALIEANYTGAKRIVGHGGSAGGMLMGAAANRAGELFAGIVAVRKYRGEGLSGDSRNGRPDRSARHLLGAGEMDRAAARHHERRRAGAVTHQYGRRPWRRVGALQPPRRSRNRLRVRALGGRVGGEG
jgi:predicted esterase